MDRIKIDQFNGLYTNIDESKLNPEYQSEAVNVRYRTGYVESEGYVASEAVLPANVIYAQMVRLDEDRFGTKVVDNELVADYKQEYTDFLLSIVNVGYNFPNEKAIYLDENIIPYQGRDIDKNLAILRFDTLYKVINIDGIVLVLTDAGTFWLGKIKRTKRWNLGETFNGYYLHKFIDFDNQIDYDIEVGKFENDFSDAISKLISQKVIDLPIVGTVILYKIEVRFADDIFYSNYRFYAGKDSSGIWKIITQGNWRLDWDIFIANIRKKDLTGWSTDITITDILNAEIEAKLIIPASDRFSHKKSELVFTYVYDGRDEYVADYRVFETNNLDYVLKLSNIFFYGLNHQYEPWEQKFRVTGIKFYFRKDDKDDFEQVFFWDLSLGKVTPNLFNSIYIYFSALDGIFLSQTIGTVYDPKDYKPIEILYDYIKIDGIAYAANSGRVYSPAIGSGMIMNGVFLDYIPEVEGDLLSDVNGTLGVHGNQLKLVVVQDSREGYLLFSIKDKMNFQVRDRYDLATSPEGIIIHTKRGIYVTNGYERKMISEEINDIVERNFDTGNISYSPIDEMLFYTFKLGNEYYTFRYDFIYGKWSEVKPGIAGRLTFSESGIIHYLNESEGKVYKLDTSDDVYSIIRTPSVDLDYPFLGKNLIYIDVDFEGILNYENYAITHTNRRTARLGIPVSKRIPNALIGARFIFKGKIYTIDIYYDAIGEFRHENHIPSPETISEGVQQYPEYLKGLTE